METLEKIRVGIRWHVPRDLPAILAIEAASFPVPWSEQEFRRVRRQRCNICLVAEWYDRVLGFMLFTLHPRRLHVLNFAVHPDYRRRGVGAQMVAKLTSKLTTHRRSRIVMDVSEGNLAGQLFFKAQGFRAIGILRDHFSGGQSAYRMVFSL